MSADVSLFHVHVSSGVPIYRQVIEQVKSLIASGQLRDGDLLPSTRALSRGLSVNMMTISKAYSKLEAEGVVERVRGRGMRILLAKPTSLKARKQEIAELLDPIVMQALRLGLSEDQIQVIVKQLLRKHEL